MAFRKILELQNEIEANILSAVLADRGIPHLVRRRSNSALEGFFQSGFDWGWIEAEEAAADTIREIYADLRTAPTEPDDGDDEAGRKNQIRSRVVVFAAAFLIYSCVVLNIGIIASTSGLIDVPQKLRPAQAVLLLGARVYSDGRVSAIVEDRIVTAVAVYRSGKAKKILVSGDHGTESYDEVTTIKQCLTAAGIPEEDIFLDHAGFNTYDSLYRAKAVFRIASLIVVTQRFHLYRALYCAERFGIDSQGAAADRRKYQDEARNELREFFARPAAFFRVMMRLPPRYVGRPFDINGDGRATHEPAAEKEDSL